MTKAEQIKEVEDLLDCALAYRKNNGEPLYANKQEILKQWVRYGARMDQAIYPDVFSKLSHELATDMTPLKGGHG